MGRLCMVFLFFALRGRDDELSHFHGVAAIKSAETTKSRLSFDTNRKNLQSVCDVLRSNQEQRNGIDLFCAATCVGLCGRSESGEERPSGVGRSVSSRSRCRQDHKRCVSQEVRVDVYPAGMTLM